LIFLPTSRESADRSAQGIGCCGRPVPSLRGFPICTFLGQSERWSGWDGAAPPPSEVVPRRRLLHPQWKQCTGAGPSCQTAIRGSPIGRDSSHVQGAGRRAAFGMSVPAWPDPLRKARAPFVRSLHTHPSPRQTGCCKGRPSAVKAHARLKSRAPLKPGAPARGAGSIQATDGCAECSCPRSTGFPAVKSR